MTVPVQRGGREDDPTVTNLILSAIDDLKSGFVRLEERISARVEDQAKQFVPRGEYEARHGEVRNLITRAEARLDTLEERLIAQRRYALTTSISAALLIIGLLSLILTNLR